MSETLLPLQRQLSNRNFLTTTGFKFTLAKNPKVDFFSNTALIPSINLGVALQSSYLKDVPIPGDKLSYDDFSLDFLVDESLENYLLIHNWLRGFGYPSDLGEYQKLLDDDKLNPGKQTAFSGQSDGTLVVYNSNFQPVANVTFRGLFPVSLSTIAFDAKDSNANYVTAQATFKYTIYDITKIEA